MSDVLARLEATIEARRDADPASSHTAGLLAQGPAKCAEKFGEEAIEAVIEAVRGDRARLIAEGADVLYHLAVMLASQDASLSDVLAELERREGMSGVAEKAARGAAVAAPVPVPAPPKSAGPGRFDVVVRQVWGPEDMEQCLDIRARVFMEEQGVSEEDERDGRDGICRHYLATVDGKPVGTARLLPRGRRAKIQRVAVLPEGRGNGIGRAIMGQILEDLTADPEVDEAYLESQTHALAFYAALGFEPEGEEFMDAGMPHMAMRRSVASA